jgi:hypothetical protein
MEKARELSKSDYFLFFDGKEVIETKDGNKPTKETLIELNQFLDQSDASVFMLNTIYGNFIYRRWNIFKNDQLYKWNSPVHEYLVTTKENSKQANLDIINIVVKGGSNSGYGTEKYMNYAAMLEEYLEEHPDSPRETYYAAQSYKDAQRMDLAIPLYKKRIKLVKNDYTFISLLELYRHYKNTEKDEKEALYYLFRMKNEFPLRLEGLYEGLMYFKEKNDLYTSYSFGVDGMKVIDSGYRATLFLIKSIYDYKFIFEFSLAAYRIGNKEEAYLAGQKINVKMPPNIGNQHKINMYYYAKYKENSIVKYNNDKIQNLHPNIVIVDNVLKDPHARREFGLQQEFSVKGNFPCCRTKSFATNQDKEMIEKALGAKINYWPNLYNGSFQFATKYDKSWIHRDNTEYSAIIYLTPDAPISSGTETFMHNKLNTTYGKGDNENTLSNDAYDKSKWEVLDSIGNLYNRMIIFNGLQSHQSKVYFGDDKNNGRLFQVFFFNIEREFPISS